MPLVKGKSKKTISKNISEFHTGKTYAHTASKFGKAKADKQAVAVALNTARKAGTKIKKAKRKTRTPSLAMVQKSVSKTKGY